MYRALFVVVMMCFVGLYATDGQVRSPQKEMSFQTEPVITKAASKDEDLIEEILQSWQTQYKQLKSFCFEIDVETLDNTFGKRSHSKCRVKLLVHWNGEYSVRLETLSDQNQPVSAYILHHDRFINVDHQLKNYAIHSSDKLWNRQEVEDLSKFLFVSVPFFVNKTSDLKDRFTMTIPQKDEDYTWIRMTPQTNIDQRIIKVGQMGVVNYSNAITPRYFPIRIMWKEPGGNDVSWDFKKVAFNDPTVVKESDFKIDPDQLALQGWSGSKSDSSNRFLNWFLGALRK